MHSHGDAIPATTVRAELNGNAAKRLFDTVREVQHRPQPPFWGSVGRRAEQGACHVLATLVHQRVGGEFIAVINEEPRRDSMRHVAVLMDGRVLDGRGSTDLSSWIADTTEEARGDPRVRIAIVPQEALGMHLGSAALHDEEQIAAMSPLADAVVAARRTDERLWRGVAPHSKHSAPGALTNATSYEILMARPTSSAPPVDVGQLRLAPGPIDRNADFSIRTAEKAFEDRTAARRNAIVAGWRGAPETVSPMRHAAIKAADGLEPKPHRTKAHGPTTDRNALIAAALSRGMGR